VGNARKETLCPFEYVKAQRGLQRSPEESARLADMSRTQAKDSAWLEENSAPMPRNWTDPGYRAGMLTIVQTNEARAGGPKGFSRK
jgi:hypothetical protein